jgi:hypothetical protein
MKSTKNPSFSGWNPIQKPPAAHFMGPTGAQAAEQAAADPEGAAAAEAAVRGSQSGAVAGRSPGVDWISMGELLGQAWALSFFFAIDVKMY